MKISVCYLLSLIVVFIVSSCATDFENAGISEEEMVNGFAVKWRRQIKSEQKNCIREILNNMVKVERGTFVMGATSEQTEFARNNEYPLSYNFVNDFYICRYEISDAQYIAILGNPNEGTALSSLFLSWSDWQEFIEVLNDLSGLNFDFPTEVQWEYAARGGKLSKGFIYPGSNDIDEIRSSSETEGSTVPNELGIYNMADLKSEWCKDYYEIYKNYQFYEDRYISSGKNHVVRGGNYRCTGKTGSKYLTKGTETNDCFGRFTEGSLIMGDYDYRYCRVSARTYYYSHQNGYIGCRVIIHQ